MKKFITRLAWRWLDREGFVVLRGREWASVIGNIDWLDAQMRRLQGAGRSRKDTPSQTPPVSAAEKQTRRFLAAFRNYLLASGRPNRWETVL